MQASRGLRASHPRPRTSAPTSANPASLKDTFPPSRLLTLGRKPAPVMEAGAVLQSVLGGAGVVMFGLVGGTGARTLTAVIVSTDRFDLHIAATSVGFGMIAPVSPAFRDFLEGPHPLLASGILMASVTPVLLCLFFDGLGSVEHAHHEAAAVAASAEHV